MIKQNMQWDYFSDQPKILDKKSKKELRKGYLKDFFKLFLTNIQYFFYLFIKFIFLAKENINEDEVSKEDLSFYGLCVNLDKGDIQYSLVEELGVKSLQVRFFLSDMDKIDDYLRFIEGFGDDKNIFITIIQDRLHIEDLKLLSEDIYTVFQKFSSVSQTFIVGNAINRIKWGFVSADEYLRFFDTISKVRNKDFKSISLIGSSVIDFEYHWTIRTLYNRYNIVYDGISSLLYVDRRGSPYNKQYKIFNLKNKINFLYTIVVNSIKVTKPDIYITETNWPISNTAPYAPTSEKECVSMELYTQYMKEYFKIAKQSKRIKIVFWHQLIAPGYGLVDNRDNKIIKTKAFYEFKEMCNQ
jgi:hypothetical protein